MPSPPKPSRAAPWAWALTAVFAAMLGFLTLTPPVSGIPAPLGDKVHHFLGFAFLALPLSWAYPRQVVWVIAGAIAFGAMIELIQPLVGRAREVSDLLADALGAGAAGWVGRVLARRRARVKPG